MRDRHPAVIIGAGPGGLTAAYELVTRGYSPIVLEKARLVGGIARTETYRGFRFDIGGHRFFTKVPVVQELWEKMLGTDFIRVPRLTHIYYQRRFLNYPLEFLNAFSQVGPVESARILSSYVKAKLSPSPEEKTFEQWVSNRFGRRLFEIFFKTYTEKVWGLPCDQIQAEWAVQRIKSLSLTSAVTEAIFRNNNGKHHSLISEFSYPVGGPGMMWKRFKDVVQAAGGSVHLNVEVVKLRREGRRIRSVIVRQGGEMTEIAGGNFLSTMPLCDLIARIEPPPPPEVIRAAQQLTYRAFLLVGLVLNRADLFPDNWIYVHSPEVRVGRIQNFKNWSATMVPDPRKTSLGMEYFCNERDPIWSWSDESLHEMAVQEIVKVGLASPGDVEDSVVIRQPRAYPVYANGYHEHIEVIRRFLYSLENLQTFGRNGMHRYNNQDHSMLSGMLAVRNLLGETHDLWSVNTDRSYQEELRYPRAV